MKLHLKLVLFAALLFSPTYAFADLTLTMPRDIASQETVPVSFTASVVSTQNNEVAINVRDQPKFITVTSKPSNAKCSPPCSVVFTVTAHKGAVRPTTLRFRATDGNNTDDKLITLTITDPPSAATNATKK